MGGDDDDDNDDDVEKPNVVRWNLIKTSWRSFGAYVTFFLVFVVG